MTASHSQHKLSHTHKHNVEIMSENIRTNKTDILCTQKKKKKKETKHKKYVLFEKKKLFTWMMSICWADIWLRFCWLTCLLDNQLLLTLLNLNRSLNLSRNLNLNRTLNLSRGLNLSTRWMYSSNRLVLNILMRLMNHCLNAVMRLILRWLYRNRMWWTFSWILYMTWMWLMLDGACGKRLLLICCSLIYWYRALENKVNHITMWTFF